MDVSFYGIEAPESWKLLKKTNSSRAPHSRAFLGAVAALAVILATMIAAELRSSWFESHLLPAIDRRLAFSVRPGPGSRLNLHSSGPYDQRLGLSDLGDFITRLEANHYEVAAQARVSRTLRGLTFIGLPPIYHEKSQAGLRIEDRQGEPLLHARYPAQIYSGFQSVPPLVVNTLLFIENRQLRNESRPRQNPAIEWGRLGKAVLDLAVHSLDRQHRVTGGSTLATQLEKVRHSPAGETHSVSEKAAQIASASLRAYLDGSDTRPARDRIACDYINSIPLAATPARGEVIGLGDGLQSWYGADFGTVNSLLSADEHTLNAGQMAARARAYREVLSLFLALRAPSWYLVHHSGALAIQTDQYLRLLAAKRIISLRLRDLALRSSVVPKPASASEHAGTFVANKASNAIRAELLSLLGLNNTYAVDRLDLTVSTTLDKNAQDEAARFLNQLSDPLRVQAAGLNQHQLLERGNPESVIYSFTLYERAAGANLLRVQTDSFDQPLDINQGTRLQLGSTAKLRTLIHYLEIVADLHDKYAAMSPAQLGAIAPLPGDNLTAWSLSWLSTATDKSLEPMLQAALQRKYSGNPGEAFFTAGGLHRFANFESSENGTMTVSEAFQRSVNLVFVRLMRDIERYYMFRVPGTSPSILTDPDDAARPRYLSRFADLEGRSFLKRFYEKYKGQTVSQALNTMVSGVNLTPLRAAVIYRSVRPQASLEQFRSFLRAHLPASSFMRESPEDLYVKYGPDKFSLQDRGYLARVHPLELWLLNYLDQHPRATLADIYARSVNERQQVYEWLFKTPHKHAQDKRIETLLEVDAFQEIQRAWKTLGYPFDSLVPSYATAIGVSGDTPAALAKLVGILVNDGVLYPPISIEQFHFAQGTPAETILTRRGVRGQRLLNPIIARLVRREMIGVVENGTGRRLRGGLKLSDGSVVPVGGKTGTGDNEFRMYGAGGGLLGSRVVNRTATFAFFIGDRFFGTVLAFVPGKAAGNYTFTSALAVQVLKDLAPQLLPLLEKPATSVSARLMGSPAPSRPRAHKAS